MQSLPFKIQGCSDVFWNRCCSPRCGASRWSDWSAPGQVGKTTLAHAVARRVGRAAYLDLERPSDAARLTDPELYLEPLADRLVIIDKIQRHPELFPALRSLVDAKRRNGRFLAPGSHRRTWRDRRRKVSLGVSYTTSLRRSPCMSSAHVDAIAG